MPWLAQVIDWGGADIMSVSISIDQRRTVARYGEASYPQACFGFLLGEKEDREKRVVELELVESTIEFSESDHFAIDPHMLSEKEAAVQARGLEVVGFFCSHPDHPARPSASSCGQASHSYTYLIVSVRQGRAHELTCWKLSKDGKAFLQEETCGA